MTYSLALVGMSMDYKEYYAGKIQDSETSEISDLLGYEMRLGYLFNRGRKSCDEISMNVMMLGGKSSYKGSLIDSGKPKGSWISTTQNQFTDAELAFAHTYHYQNDLHLIYGLGLGFHAWDRKLSSTQEELYQWFSLRPMIGANADIERFNLGVVVQYQYGFDRTMSSTNPVLDVTLGGADIFKVSFPIKYSYSDEVEFFAETTFSKQEIKESNHVRVVINNRIYEVLEPDSTNYSSYLKLGATLKF